jgi:malonyl CoA-acyl carrier protein transacylase
MSVSSQEKLSIESEIQPSYTPLVERNPSEDSVAIVGIACRFPGANNYNQFWHNLEKGTNSITEIPSNRWDINNFYSPSTEEPNKSISKWGGFIEDVDKFDAQFFKISPREAKRIDPQQRLMMELTWSCLEDAGYLPLKLSGSNIGVFIGACNFDYKELQEKYEDDLEGHTATGTYTCMIPNRISYFFNFYGPSVPVDTACSSSLVAIHLAVNALQKNECEMAIVGGVSVLCTPTSYITFSKLGMLSPAGQCKTFDANADGYVRGEGAGVILLKPLSKAIKDKDYIYGVIKGTAVNHGGHARTLTSPNAYAQSKVIRDAYTKADIPPNTVSFIETHGTGTPLGDPIEINGLKRAFTQLHQQYGVEPTSEAYCGLGAVKTNIGHLESASGIAGVIKVLLAMKHKKLPAINNFQELNPRIKLDSSPFYIVKETQDWQPLKTKEGEELPRRASVSSFGFGGVNAHIVLEEPPETQLVNNDINRPQHLVTLSAKSEKALRELVNRYAEFLLSQSEVSLADVCFTANTGREHFEYRLAVIAESTVQLQETLSAFAAGKQTAGLISGQVTSDNPLRIAFLFTGQGSQYADMGRQLYETQPTFRQILERCDRILRPYLEMPLLEVLYPANGQHSPINETAYTQPALFAVEYALAELWKSWGIKPDIVMGHSVGEYVAACVAGVFSLEDGLKLIAERGRLMQALPQNGEMVAVLADESIVQAAIQPYARQVSIAAFNGSRNIVISGDRQAISKVVASLETQGIEFRKLKVSHAFHSPLMEPMLAAFEQVASEITLSPPQIDIISNVTGQLATTEIATPEYWCTHIQQPVRFAAGMETLHRAGYEVFLEMGPKPILLGMGRAILESPIANLQLRDTGKISESSETNQQSNNPKSKTRPQEEVRGQHNPKLLWLPSLRPGFSCWQQLFQSLSELYIRGISVDWSGFDRDYQRQRLGLPTYPFQGQRYWIETREKPTYILSQQNTPNSIVNLLDKGDTKQLALQLEKVGDLSENEAQLLPKLLELLVKQFQQDYSQVQIETENESSAETQSSEFLQHLEKTPPKERLALLVAHIQNEVATVMGLPPSQAPSPQVGFFEMGLDSMMVVELQNRLRNNLGLSLSTNLAFNYPNIEALAGYLVRDFFSSDMLSEANNSSQNNADDLAELAAKLEQISEEEMEVLLMQKLETL